MKEPNLEAMLDFLIDLGNSIGNSTKSNIYEILTEQGRDVTKEISQVIYFSSEERVATVENEVAQLDDAEKKSSVFIAIMALYPLTKNVVIQLLKKADVKPSDYLLYYDNTAFLLGIMKDNIDNVKNSSQYSNVAVNNYSSQLDKLQNDICKLEKTRERLENSIEGYKEKSDIKEELVKEIEELERIKDSGIDKEIENLQNEKKRLENEKEEKDRRKIRLKDEINNLMDELSQSSTDKNKKYQEALNCLQKCMAELAK